MRDQMDDLAAGMKALAERGYTASEVAAHFARISRLGISLEKVRDPRTGKVVDVRPMVEEWQHRYLPPVAY